MSPFRIDSIKLVDPNFSIRRLDNSVSKLDEKRGKAAIEIDETSAKLSPDSWDQWVFCVELDIMDTIMDTLELLLVIFW